MADEVHYRDFTKKRKPVYFKIDDDTFHCVEALAPDTLQDIMKMIRTETDASETDRAAAVLGKLRGIFQLFLLEESFEVFASRLGNSRKPIDVGQLLDITSWIVEVYTGRPTTPSESSSPSSASADGGTSLTAGAPLAELTPSS